MSTVYPFTRDALSLLKDCSFVTNLIAHDPESHNGSSVWCMNMEITTAQSSLMGLLGLKFALGPDVQMPTQAQLVWLHARETEFLWTLPEGSRRRKRIPTELQTLTDRLVRLMASDAIEAHYGRGRV